MSDGEITEKKRAVSPINGQPVPMGRTKGVPNKATQAAREAIASFVDNNAPRLQAWLDQVAEKDPEKAFNLFQSVVEYHIPKLARTEQQTLDKNGEPADAPPIKVEFINAPTNTSGV